MLYFAEDSLPGLQLPLADPQAEVLNQRLQTEAPAIYNMLSPCGKSLYYPKQGLLLQAEEAADSRYNGTVGIALDDAGKPMHYSSISRMLHLDTSCCVPYASSYGLPVLRQLWGQQLPQKNPVLESKRNKISLPVVTGGITHGLWIAFQMFLGRGDELLLPHLYWPNYRLIAQANCGAKLKSYNTFSGNGLDIRAIYNELMAPGDKKVLLFNFPHNPTGYSPSKSEVAELQAIFLEAANIGKRIVVLCDDAYWGLCYEPETERQSLFSFVCDLHENILAVKLDGATKEDFSWGLRVGFITFGYRGQGAGAGEAQTVSPDEPICKVLEEKAGAAVRLSTSNSSRLSQELLLAVYQDSQTQGERESLQKILAARYRTLRQCLSGRKAQEEWSRYLKPLPFNSGYFMTFEIQADGLSADALRKHLLACHDIGLIALQDRYLRFAFSAVAERDIPHVLETLHRSCRELGDRK
ncbi:MAG: aminotransferase class I/II-fold pyridoxal phosphate-dependent enzyme [Spirochaetota bacterium]